MQVAMRIWQWDWWRRLAGYRIVDVAAVTVALSVIVLWSMSVPSRWSEFDFNHYYVGGRMLLEGQNPYRTSLKAMSDALGFRFSEVLPIAGYPPSFLWLFTLLAALPPRTAFAIWVAGEIACLAVILWLTRQLLGKRLSARGWLFVAVLAVTSWPVMYHLLFSQVQLLLAALVLAAYAAYRAGHHGWACLAVSVAGILKFYPFVLLPWFVWSGSGGARMRLYRVLGVAGFVLAVVALTRPALWRDFMAYGIPMGVGEEIGRNFHFSLSALVTNLGYAHHDFHPSLQDKHWWWIAGTMTGLAVIAGAYAVCFTAQRDSESQFCLLCVAMLMGTVTVQGHYFVFLIFPLTVVAARIAAKPSARLVIYLVLLVVAVNCVEPPEWSFLRGHSVLYILVSDLPLYALIGLGVFFSQEILRQPASTPLHTESRMT
jgi:hypothetical protein